MSVFEITFLSVKRRMPQIIKAACTTLVAVFFVTAVLIFQDNMYQWQMSSNKSRFGDWFLYEITSEEPNKSLSEHAYLNDPVKIMTSVSMFNSDWKRTGYIVGSFDKDFINQVRISLDEGRLPENDDEIAMDWNTLLSLGYTGEIGETVIIRYCEENSIYDESARQEKEFRLVGILANYTNIWKNGKNIPGAVVTPNALEIFNYKCRNVYFYSLNDAVKTSDYATVYKKIKEDAKTETVYNSAVYDYQPWSSAKVYMYMYLVVMIIGILALSYQLIEYRGRRRPAYERFRKLGMNKASLRSMYIIENALIIIPAGIMGLILALLTGFGIGKALEIHNGFTFYKVTLNVIIKSVLSVIIAIIVEEIAGIIANSRKNHILNKKRKKKNSQNVNIYNATGKKSKIKPSNLLITVSSRFIGKDGIFMAAGLRIFALCICAVLVFSALMIKKVYIAYKDNEQIPDIYGYLDPSDSEYEMYIYYYSYIKGYYNIPIPDGEYYSEERNALLSSEKRNRYNISFNELKSKLTKESDSLDANNHQDLIRFNMLHVNYSNKYCKRGNTNLLTGFSEEFLTELEKIGGIKSVDYSAYESERTWFWDNQDFHKMGMDTISPDNYNITRESPVTDYGYRYIYSTEYVNPTRELYNKLEKYIDKEYRNYDDFVNGKQVVVFLRNTPDGTYDDTLQAGDILNYNYYPLSVMPNIRFTNNVAYGRYTYPFDRAFYDTYNNSGKINLYSEFNGTLKGSASFNMHSEGDSEDWINGYESIFGACVSPQVAAVIKVTDDVKEDFNGIMPDYGYYTALAGMSLAQQAVDNQRSFMERITGDKMNGYLEFGLKYNQLNINYDLSSTFSATNNKVAVYFDNNELSYSSNVDAKNIYRTQLINNILQYGITIAAVIVIQLLIMAIIVRNRIERRKASYKLLHGIGMRQGTIVKMCMIEAVRESVWCIFTMPLILILELLMYMRKNLVE